MCESSLTKEVGRWSVISELARRSLEPVGVASDHGFPVFDVDDDAPPITSEDVTRAADDE